MIRTVLLTSGALVAFAANSLVARLALGTRAIDPSSYAAIRFGSGALLLVALAAASSGRRGAFLRPNWNAAAWLSAYAVPFSFAYVDLSTGTGALILFGAVQTTMLVSAVGGGERLQRARWIGLAVAVAGVIYLVSPGLDAPSLSGSLLMGVAGIAWGLYSLHGRQSSAPLAATAANLLYASPLLVAVAAAAGLRGALRLTGEGVALALLSGTITSALGYVIWYAALGGLSASRAAVVQLLVPVLAALAGVVMLGEPVTWRLAIASALILGGVGLALGVQPTRTLTTTNRARL